MDRRTFLAGVTATLAAGCIPTQTDHGPLVASSVPGLWVPKGFTARRVATSWERVAGYTWHGHPDGGACFDAGDQWVYVSNSESEAGQGGVSALRFDRSGATVGAYRVLAGTTRNCAGGRYWYKNRWWWVSCEEMDRGQAWLCDPLKASQGTVLPWGRFRREAIAHHVPTDTVYQSEDETDGCLYRWDIGAGRLEVLSMDWTWKVVPDPQATTTATRYQVPDARRFNGGEGIAVAGDLVLLCTKGDGRTWRYNIGSGLLDVAYDPQTSPGARHLATGDNIVATTTSAFVSEDGGNMEIVGLNLTNGATNPVVRYECTGSEMTGPAFSPDRRHLLFSSQRKPGMTFMVTGPWA